MIKHCSKNITPDSITGMIFALEGIKNTIVLLNGPMGCKFYHSTTSQYLTIKPALYLPLSEDGKKVPVDYNFLNNWFFRQSRVPCTYLDGYDYVYGTSEKVAEGLRYLKEHVEFDLLAIVNSPGASLIGDNLKELANQILPDCLCVMLESPGYSQNYSVGYEEAILELFNQVGKKLWVKNSNNIEKKSPLKPKTINLLGMSIWHRYLDGDKAELIRLFELCNIHVNCCPGADCSLEELKKLPEADLNVVIYPEMGRRSAEYLEECYNTPYYMCPGPPIGFKAVETMFSQICRLLGLDCTPVMMDSEKARALAWAKIDYIYQMFGLPKGVSFAVEGSWSEVYSYTRFLIEYLGMIPDCLSITGEKEASIERELTLLLEKYHAGQPEKKDIMDTSAELVFANANTIAALKLHNQVFCGIEISLPGMGYIDVIPKTHMGIQGALFLVEQVLNGLMSKL